MGLEVCPVVAVGGQEIFELYYPGDDLGAVYSPDSTAFRVFAPTALGVSVMLYSSRQSAAGWEVPMSPDCDGTWLAVVFGDLAGICYTYRVFHGGCVKEAVDPYARALTVNGGRGVVIDPASTDPEGWAGDVRPPLAAATDAVVYEVHVRDFSISPDSGTQHRGRYLGMSEHGTRGPGGVSTGVDHLVELGITHVHLLPIQDFASVDELSPDGYNWGYDPFHFFVPEGSYSCRPECAASRVTEVKRMVQALHRAGLRVVLDVVYNHTYSTDDSPLQTIVPGYYHRTDAAGVFTNGSGCGNELATERPMVRKLIVDSLKYWVREYHVDGFRFDLMALIDCDTMQEIACELRAIEPSLLLYGEPWTGGPSGLCHTRMFTAGRQRSTGIGMFNDAFRNAIKGDNDGGRPGYATGAAGCEREIAKGVVASIRYSDGLSGFAQEPGECVNYVSCHDNLTLWDKIARSNAFDSKGDRISMDLLAQAIVLTSQGIPFLEGGAELLRTKRGHHNSYRAGDEVNQFEWWRKHEFREVFDYYRGLIEVRRAHPAFRMTTAAQVRAAVRFIPGPPGTVLFELDGSVCGDEWDFIAVIYNANRHEVEIALPTHGEWSIVVARRQAGTRPLDDSAYMVKDEEGDDVRVRVPAISAMVLYS
ncbi:MAG TPA: type I pullulanase [Bacillota bacterium]|jgi:pullulanase|nr:type I pullulanase [Bacillota bacterium]HNY67102.1 type I pullulanase [Bacillota bacterium]HOI35818.1 type I pullulanase [Bacillota bacterium]HPU75015.1 type I pullulanase [Bacillota bacterium]